MLTSADDGDPSTLRMYSGTTMLALGRAARGADGRDRLVVGRAGVGLVFQRTDAVVETGVGVGVVGREVGSAVIPWRGEVHAPVRRP